MHGLLECKLFNLSRRDYEKSSLTYIFIEVSEYISIQCVCMK